MNQSNQSLAIEWESRIFMLFSLLLSHGWSHEIPPWRFLVLSHTFFLLIRYKDKMNQSSNQIHKSLKNLLSPSFYVWLSIERERLYPSVQYQSKHRNAWLLRLDMSGLAFVDWCYYFYCNYTNSMRIKLFFYRRSSKQERMGHLETCGNSSNFNQQWYALFTLQIHCISWKVLGLLLSIPGLSSVSNGKSSCLLLLTQISKVAFVWLNVSVAIPNFLTVSKSFISCLDFWREGSPFCMKERRQREYFNWYHKNGYSFFLQCRCEAIIGEEMPCTYPYHCIR